MNKEEAIDILANCIDDYVIGDFCVGKFCPMENECKDKECVFHLAIETVLNLIKKQQEEIETLKRDFEIVDHECSRLEKEDIKKDMMIKQLKDKLIGDKMEQFDDYVIYLIESYLEILEKGKEE